MKKKIFLFTLLLIMSLCSYTVNAGENKTNKVLTDGSYMKYYSEKDTLQDMASDIISMANCFHGDGFYSEPSDIQFEDAYCVYVDADILQKSPLTQDELTKQLNASNLVWNIPVVSNEKTVIVQISKALEPDEIAQSELTVDEIETMKENAGKWQVVSASIYETGETPMDNLNNALSSNFENLSNYKCVLLGGERGIHSMLALVLENENVTGGITLQGDINYKPLTAKNKQESNSTFYYTILLIIVVGGIVWGVTRYSLKHSKKNS